VNGAAEAERLLVARGLSPELEAHCRRVAATAGELAGRWSADPGAAELAGLLHDYCRELTREEVLEEARKHDLEVSPLEAEYPVQLLHGPLAARVLAAGPLTLPAEVLEAIARHTVGGPAMSTLARCLFVADSIEPGRTYRAADDLRRLASRSLDGALREIVRRDVVRLEKRGRAVHPAMRAMTEEMDG
jgi:predicted HD superfamily hydrolase involved in NAD metabolism